MDKNDEYKIFAEKSNVDYEYEHRALEIVKKFVIERKRIIFGGYAIDKALRLKGDKIYHDDEKPDIDIYSPDSVGDAYDLVDIFRKAGFIKVAAIRGVHIQTMRVRTNFIYVIDIGYVPPQIYNNIPYLNYNGLCIVDPLYQRIDFHISNSLPYFGAPRENILNRWEKDEKRLALFDKYYPVEKYIKSKNIPKFKQIKIPSPDKSHALYGLAAYAASYLSLMQLLEETKNKIDVSDIPKIIISADDNNLLIETFEDHFTLISPHNESTFASYIEKIPEYKIVDNIIIYSSYLNLLSVCKVKINEHDYLCSCINYTMTYLLTKYFITQNEYYLHLYVGAQKIMKISREIYEKMGVLHLNTPFSLCIDTIGTKNMSKAYLIRMAKNIRQTRDEKNYPKYLDPIVETILNDVPKEYYDERPEKFDYKSEQFKLNGEKLLS